MEPVDVEIVDESTHVESESTRESIRDEWVGATAAYKLADLTKSSFGRAMSHLIGVRNCRVDSLRRGDAQKTRYSALAIELVKALVKSRKSGDESPLQQLLELAKSSVPSQSSALAVVDHVATLEEKIANLRQAAAANSEMNSDRIRGKLAEIALCNQSGRQQNEALNAAQSLAAENQGIEDALVIFSVYQKAKKDTLAHLRALEISENQ